MRLFSACLIVILFAYFLSVNIVWGRQDYNFEQVSEAQISEALTKTVPLRFIPSSPFYFLISIKESISRFFKPSSLYKTEFDFVLSGKRLKEAYLLTEKNDIKNASAALIRYSQVVDRGIKQLEKAKSQNQDIVGMASRTFDQLGYQDKLLVALWQKSQGGNNQNLFDQNLEISIQNFQKLVMAIDSIKPGVKNRYIITKTIKEDINQPAVVLPSPSPIIESSKSVVPRRIIY